MGEITFVAAIGFLIFLIWMNRNEAGVATSATNAVSSSPVASSVSQGPSAPRPQFIYDFPPAPDLSQYKLVLPNSSGPPPSPITPSPSPCDCGCSGNANIQTQLSQTVSAFAANLTTQLGVAYGKYLDNLAAAIPPEYQQFVNNQGAQAASDNERANVLAVSSTTLKQTGFNALGDIIAGNIATGQMPAWANFNITGLQQKDTSINKRSY